MLVDKQRSVMPCGFLFLQLRLGILEFAAGEDCVLGYFGVWFAGLLRHFAGGEVLRGRDWVF